MSIMGGCGCSPHRPLDPLAAVRKQNSWPFGARPSTTSGTGPAKCFCREATPWHGHLWMKTARLGAAWEGELAMTATWTSPAVGWLTLDWALAKVEANG
jgi:hypothetical protein